MNILQLEADCKKAISQIIGDRVFKRPLSQQEEALIGKHLPYAIEALLKYQDFIHPEFAKKKLQGKINRVCKLIKGNHSTAEILPITCELANDQRFICCLSEYFANHNNLIWRNYLIFLKEVTNKDIPAFTSAHATVFRKVNLDAYLNKQGGATSIYQFLALFHLIEMWNEIFNKMPTVSSSKDGNRKQGAFVELTKEFLKVVYTHTGTLSKRQRELISGETIRGYIRDYKKNHIV